MLFTFRRKNVQNNSYPGKRFFINREEQSRRKMYSHKQVARVERYASIYYFQQAEFWMEFVSKEKKKEETKKEREKLKFNGKIFIHGSEKGINVRRGSVHSVTQ